MKRLLTVIIIITIAIASTACSSNKVKNQEELKLLNNTSDNIQGNSNANITNGGKVAIQEDRMYFGVNDGLYKSKADESDKQVFFKGTEKNVEENTEQNQDKIEKEITNQIEDSLERREPGYMKEYNAISLSKKNINEYPYPEGGRTWVSKLKIEDNNLIVWGSLECTESGSSEIKYIEEKKRTFKLSENVDLGLDWVGSKEEQIQHFNDMGEDLSSMFYFRTIKDEVTYITFAG